MVRRFPVINTRDAGAGAAYSRSTAPCSGTFFISTLSAVATGLGSAQMRFEPQTLGSGSALPLLGKALQPLPKATGVIQVLVTLQ